MATGRPSVNPILKILDSSGNPVVGAKIYVYVTGTTTLTNSWSDLALTSLNTNPVVTDSDGNAIIFLDPEVTYRFYIRNAADTATIDDIDPVMGLFSPLQTSYKSENIKFANNKGICDSNGNEILTVTSTTSAVNQFNITNAATGNGVSMLAQGDDSNIPATFGSKGTSPVKIKSGGVTFTLPVADGSSGHVMQTDGNGELSLASLPATATTLPYLFKSGCILANNATDSVNDIDIGAGAVRDMANSANIINSSTLTKRLDATWASGTGNGGRPAAISLSANTWYHVFLINDGSTTDAGIDTSLSCTNLLSASSYTKYRRVGSVLWDGSTIVQFIQTSNNEFEWMVPASDYATAAVTSRTNTALSVPTGIKVRARMNVAWILNATSGALLLSNPAVSDTAPSYSTGLATIQGGFGVGAGCQAQVWTNTSRQISQRATTTSANVYLRTLGWYDPFEA